MGRVFRSFCHGIRKIAERTEIPSMMAAGEENRGNSRAMYQNRHGRGRLGGSQSKKNGPETNQKGPKPNAKKTSD